jgi:hypothetical protein
MTCIVQAERRENGSVLTMSLAFDAWSIRHFSVIATYINEAKVAFFFWRFTIKDLTSDTPYVNKEHFLQRKRTRRVKIIYTM